MSRNYLSILRKLSLYKCLNVLKLFLGFHFSRLTGRVYQWALPVFISIEPTTSCNLRCPQCPSGLREFTRPTGMLREELFSKIILQVKRHVHSLTFYFQGEPYLHPDFLKMVSFAASHGIYTITSTNAHYLDETRARATVESGLEELIVSVDGSTQESYSQYRVGGQLEKVIEGTKQVLAAKQQMNRRHPHVVWQFVVFKHNQNQIAEIKSLAKEIGVNELRIKTAQVYDFEQAGEWIPDIAEYSRYRKDQDGIYRIKNKLLNQCWRMWQGCVITWDGKIVPCCFDKDAKHKLGDLQSQSFKDIWFSPEYQAFRKSILKGRSKIDICNNCTEGTKVFA